MAEIPSVAKINVVEKGPLWRRGAARQIGNRVLFLSNPTAMARDCIQRERVHGARRVGRALLVGVVTAAMLFAVSTNAYALFVGAQPNVLPDTTGNPGTPSPIDGSHLATGDPGWGNAAHTFPYFTNGVYLGNGWMLTANHANFSSATFVEGGTSYNVVPNQAYQVPNPSVGDPQLSQTYADLKLYRIGDDPNLPSLTIASNPLALNDQVVFVTTGVLRSPTEVHWNSDWTTTTGAGTYQGYTNNGGGKVWGTNNVANDSVLGDQFVSGPGHTSCQPSNPSDQCDASDSNITTNVNHGTIAYLTTYDKQNAAGNPYEAQVVGGDSGSPVFHKTASGWELAGIVLATYTYSGQDAENAVYGDASAFADLSSYKANILAIMAAHQDYSVVGDLTMDGVAGQADDIAAFVAGWHYNNGTGQGTLTSWKHGDLNHDGKTDVADFLEFRSGLSAGAGATLNAMMGSLLSGAVPEPSTMFLVVGPAIFFALRGRKRSSRVSV